MEVQIVPISKTGKPYLTTILGDKPTVVTRALLYGITGSSGEVKVSLKLGRFKKPTLSCVGNKDIPEVETPKSYLTLNSDELNNLISFIQNNYNPFSEGIKSYLAIGNKYDNRCIEYLKELFESPEKQELIQLISSNSIISDELVIAFENVRRQKAVQQFEIMLLQDLDEQRWQLWFQENNWVLGSDCVKILDERKIDTQHITDYLVKAFDGFLDIIEIKRPEGKLKFWHQSKDHDNYFPSADLTKAIAQTVEYIHRVELKADSIDFRDSVDNTKTIKPRCILIFGRSNDWNSEQQKAFRLLNSSYHNITILTYDHVLTRAKRIVGLI